MADELTPADFPQGELLFYTSKDGKVKMEIRVEDETIWMSQQMMAELFQTTKQNVAKHLKRIFEQGELPEESVVNYWLTTAADGKNYSVAYYNLDAIISVGYRVNSIRGTQFRIWATQQLSELMRKLVFMNEWEEAIDSLLKLTGREVLQGKGSRSMTNARKHAQEQYRLFCERRREAAEQLGELELQKHLEEEIRQIRP